MCSPLLIGQPGVGGQVVQGDGRATGQGICFADEHVGAGGEQRVELQLVLPDDPGEHRGVEGVEIEHAHLAAQPGHVLDDLIGLGLPDAEVILRPAVLLQQVHKGLHREGIVLGGHAEPVSPGGGTGVALFNQVGLLQHLAGIAQKLVPRGG